MRAASNDMNETKPQLGAWLSFADKHKPRGSQFVGVAVVKADGANSAVARCIELDIWPSGVAGLDVEIVAVDLNQYSPQDMDRMLTREDAIRLGNEVTVTRKGTR